MGKPILCVDFDGVIHAYTTKWTDAVTISDGPTPGALRWLWKATEWFDVQVYSSRSKDPMARLAMMRWMSDHSRRELGPEHPMSLLDDDGPYPITFAYEKPAAFLTIDDRAICFEGDWSDMEPADLLTFKPWNKRTPIPGLGATGAFPEGKLNADDQGELRMAVGRCCDLVHVDFGKPVAWFALPTHEAKELAALLLRHAGATVDN